MVCTWPSSTTDEPFGTSFAVSAITASDVGGDRAEVAALRRRVDLHHRLDVVVRDHGAATSTRLMSAMPPRIGGCGLPVAVIGRFCSALSESIWYCGVCITIG